MDLCNVACTHVAVYDRTQGHQAGYSVYNVNTGQHCCFLPQEPHTIEIQWPYLLCAHDNEIKLWRMVDVTVHVASLQAKVHAMAFVEPQKAVIVWDSAHGLSWGVFAVSPKTLLLLRSGQLPKGQVGRVSASHIEARTSDGLRYYDMYRLESTPRVDRRARLRLRPTVPIKWDEIKRDNLDCKHWSLMVGPSVEANLRGSVADGVTLAIDVPMYWHAGTSSLTRFRMLSFACNNSMHVLCPGVAVSPDRRFVVIREERPLGRYALRIERRRLPLFEGVLGNRQEHVARKTQSHNARLEAYLAFERLLHRLLSPALPPTIIDDVFMCF